MKLIIGAGGKSQDGWTSTEEKQLNLLNREDFVRVLEGAVGYESILVEDVFEHLTTAELPIALRNCFDFLSPSGRLRISTPDGFHPDKGYIKYISPPNMGHKILYNYRLLGRLLEETGFRVVLLEWWDENGKFNTRPWYEKDGHIERCLANDSRNYDGKPHYTSLIVDAIKDVDITRPNLENAFAFVEEHDIYKVSPFNRKKTMTFYELARLAPEGGVIVELGSHHGIGTSALWYGAKDGNRCKLYAVDSYSEMRGWADEPYGIKDKDIWIENMKTARISPELVQGDADKLSWTWKYPISLLVHDLGTKNRMHIDVMNWEKYIIVGGVIALRDIDDYSMGTERAIFNLLQTGKWGNRRNWEAFITSVERIA
jgi:predicted SAM-dependent methyltransferase